MSAIDGMKAQLAGQIARATSRFDYHAIYPCEVLAQNGQTVDLKPDSAKVPPVSRVPLRLGLPGVEVAVALGSRVMLQFENGDGQRPVATLWEKSSLVSITMDPSVSLLLGGGATSPVAKGDLLVAAVSTALSGIATALTAMGSPAPTAPMIGSLATAAGTAIESVATAFDEAAELALSAKVKVA